MDDAPESPRRSRRGGIRRYLVGLALLVSLPLAAVSVARIVAQRANATNMAEESAVRMARLIAVRVDERLQSADALLTGLSAQPRTGPMHGPAADSALAHVLHASRGLYANVFIIDSLGTIVSSAMPLPRGVDSVGAVSDRGYFLGARGSTNSVIGAPIRSRLQDGAWIVVLARRLHSDDSSFNGVVGVAILLDSFHDVVSNADLLGAPLVTLLDSSGIVIARSETGTIDRDAQRIRLPPDFAPSGVGHWSDFEGNERISGYLRISAAPWYVSIGILRAATIAAARSRLIDDFLILLLAGSVAVLIAYLFGQRITRPLSTLADDARALSLGVSGHRNAVSGPLEIRELGAAFNQMADTVERRNAALADSERRYRLLFESNPLPMWAWETDTLSLLAVNEAALDHYGYSRDAFLGLRITDLLDPSEIERFSEVRLPFVEAQQRGGVWKHRTADGALIEMEIVTTSSRRLGRASWLSVGIDITSRRMAERALAASEEQLRQSQKMEAVGAFAGGIAHDFNNLLTGMLGYCDLLLENMNAGEERHADVQEIRGLAMRGADLTKQILAISRKQVLQPMFFDPNVAVRGLDRLLRRVIGEDIAFDTVLTEDMGSVCADAGQLEQVVLNLAANARDAMPDGGDLCVESFVVTTEQARRFALDEDTDSGVCHSGAGTTQSSGWIAISVRDSGTGMSAEVQQRVFEPFFTTKERGKGTGLGLALAYGAMQQTGGAIRVESEEGVGTTVYLLLPRYPERRAEVGTDARVDENGAGTETILVAEDEESVRAVLSSTLRARGYRVLAAANGAEALSIARQFPDRIDLLLTDVVMPGMNGRELAEAFAKDRPDVPVLFASGYTDDALKGVRTDELSFIQKPFTPTQIVRRVRSMLDAPVRAT